MANKVQQLIFFQPLQRQVTLICLQLIKSECQTQHLDEESHRVESYLHPSTLAPLIKKVEEILIYDQLEAIYTEVKTLLHNEKYSGKDFFEKFFSKMFIKRLVDKLSVSNDFKIKIPVSPFQFNIDDDVAAKQQRIYSYYDKRSGDVLRMIDLVKIYVWRFGKNFTVVKQSECFNLLGINRSGKSTIFTMLTGEISMTDDNAFVNNCSVIK
ncbi:unnamed protein product [Rotaria sordida]|uniref:Cullin N-terminal domain-containing protein n=2 Tax=Rotaria sordida TaxID=392033 RepID=A0A815PRB2_9BILA|nr:unnamed protein product [Rotaria sordida]